jgi:serine/threonine protein kinase
MNFKWPQFSPTPLSQIVPQASKDSITLIGDMLKWNPAKRPSASQSLRYPYFQVGQKLGGLNDSHVSLKTRQSAAAVRLDPAVADAEKPAARNNRPSSSDSFADAFGYDLETVLLLNTILKIIRFQRYSYYKFSGKVSQTSQMSKIEKLQPNSCI